MNKTILLVEDEILIALDKEKQLIGAGYNVITAFSGEDAVRIAGSGDYSIDLVLMDVDLGRGIDGFTACSEIRRHYDIPVLFLSSHSEKDVLTRTDTNTSCGFVIKHTGIENLDASIKSAFKLHKCHRDSE